jgi:hypothetical protein
VDLSYTEDEIYELSLAREPRSSVSSVRTFKSAPTKSETYDFFSLIKQLEVYLPVIQQPIQHLMYIRKKNKFIVLSLPIGQLELVNQLIFKQFNDM